MKNRFFVAFLISVLVCNNSCSSFKGRVVKVTGSDGVPIRGAYELPGAAIRIGEGRKTGRNGLLDVATPYAVIESPNHLPELVEARKGEVSVIELRAIPSGMTSSEIFEEKNRLVGQKNVLNGRAFVASE